MPTKETDDSQNNAVDIDEAKLGELIKSAWEQCISNAADLDNRKRSNCWVKRLGANFDEHYADCKDYRVFWRGNPDNKPEFTLTEMLYDILVCRTDTTYSMESRPRQLEFIAQAIWTVESEFEKNTRDILLDMSKLVVTNSINKLLIVSDRDERNEQLRCRLSPVAEKIHGGLFLGFVTHPDDWCEESKPPQLYRWHGKKRKFEDVFGRKTLAQKDNSRHTIFR